MLLVGKRGYVGKRNPTFWEGAAAAAAAASRAKYYLQTNFGRGTAGGTLLGLERDGMAIDFTAAIPHMLIRDRKNTTKFSGNPFDKLTFTRASTAYYYNSSGVLTQAASGAARIDYNPATLAARGLLVEEQRTNIVLYSQEFNQGNWTKNGHTVSTNSATSPDGTADAETLTVSVSGVHQTNQAHSLTNATAYTSSVYVKSNGYPFVGLRIYLAQNNWVTHVFNLSTGAVSQTSAGASSTFTAVSSAIQDVGNGWYRIILTTTVGSTASFEFVIQSHSSATPTLSTFGDESWGGDSASGIFVYGAQREAGSFATSYIPTTTASVTRAADDTSIATTLFPYSATLGSLYASCMFMSVAALSRALNLDDGTANERVTLGINASAAGLLNVVDGGTEQAGASGITSGTFVALTAAKIAASWAANDLAVTKDAAAPTTDTSATLPTMTTLRLGHGPSVAAPINGWLRQIVHLPRAMSDAELQTRTT